MVRLLLLVKKIINYNKENIDKGLTPLRVYKLCSCIRETFCLSYSIRKNNIIYLYFQKDCILIKFEGNKLRYLGPDERSQALLLQKAIKKACELNNHKHNDWNKSTPGIFIRKFSNHIGFIEFYASISKGTSYFITGEYQEFEEEPDSLSFFKDIDEIHENDFFIFPTYKISKENLKIIKMFIDLPTVKIILLLKIKTIEDKILYINFRTDKQRIL